MTNSIEKGKRGERAWRDFLREQGFKARRGQQYAGGGDSPDVICESLPSYHHEVKVGAQVPQKPYNFLDQAIRDSRLTDKTPIVAIRRDYCDWLVIMRAQDWANLVKEQAIDDTQAS